MQTKQPKVNSEWREVTLGEICDLNGGSVFPRALQGKISGEYPFAKVSDMNLPANTIRIQGANNWVDEDDIPQLKAKPLPAGATIFAKIGEALKQNRLRFLVRPTIVDNNMMGAIPLTEHIDPQFLFYALSQFDFGEIAGGTALPYLTIRDVSSLSFYLPSLPEQRAIAHILGTLDDKIELNRRMNQTLEETARAIFKDWFVDFGPTRAKIEGREPYLPAEAWDLFPDCLVASELGEIPTGWSVGSLADIADYPRRGVSPSDLSDNTPYIGLQHMPRRSIALGEWEYAGQVSSGKSAFKKGEFLFGKLRPYFHKVGIAPMDGICSTDIVVLRPKVNHYSALLLSYISDDAFVMYTDQTSTGTKMPRTSWKTMSNYKISLSQDNIVVAFQSLSQKMFDQIITNIHETRNLIAQRDTLLPKLVSGELRVRDKEQYLKEIL